MDSAIKGPLEIGCAADGIGIALLFAFFILRQFVHIGRPGELLLFSGRQRQLADGSSVDYRTLIGRGWTWRWPLLEKVYRTQFAGAHVQLMEPIRPNGMGRIRLLVDEHPVDVMARNTTSNILEERATALVTNVEDDIASITCLPDESRAAT